VTDVVRALEVYERRQVALNCLRVTADRADGGHERSPLLHRHPDDPPAFVIAAAASASPDMQVALECDRTADCVELVLNGRARRRMMAGARRSDAHVEVTVAVWKR
jgi:hypothetical protein